MHVLSTQTRTPPGCVASHAAPLNHTLGGYAAAPAQVSDPAQLESIIESSDSTAASGSTHLLRTASVNSHVDECDRKPIGYRDKSGLRYSLRVRRVR